ncbi:MAG: DUF3592 domain-containing protein [bacterium]
MKIALIISLLIALIGMVSFLNTYREISRSKVCWGVVTDLPVSSDSDGTTYGVTAEFLADNNKKYTYNSSWKTSNPGYSVGDRIRVYYNPDNPTINGIMSFMGAYGFVFIVICISLLVAATMYISLNSYQVIEWIHPNHFQQLEIQSMSGTNTIQNP